MVWPKAGTLPVRGDLAHIAMADRYLVPHYVVPHAYSAGADGAQLLLTADAASQVLADLAPGAAFEVLDLAGEWYWGCIGPEGPSGYIQQSQLAPLSA